MVEGGREGGREGRKRGGRREGSNQRRKAFAAGQGKRKKSFTGRSCGLKEKQVRARSCFLFSVSHFFR